MLGERLPLLAPGARHRARPRRPPRPCRTTSSRSSARRRRSASSTGSDARTSRVEVVESSPGDRAEAVRARCSRSVRGARRSSTRRRASEAEALAEELSPRLPRGGLPRGDDGGRARRSAQRAFLGGRASRSSSRRSRSAWGSTRPTCAPSSTRRCPRRSRATTRRSAAPAGTGRRRERCFSTRSPTARRTSSSTSATTRRSSVARAPLRSALSDAPIAKDALAASCRAGAGGVREGAREALAARRRARRPRRGDSPRRRRFRDPVRAPAGAPRRADGADAPLRREERVPDAAARRALRRRERPGDAVRPVRRVRARELRRARPPRAEPRRARSGRPHPGSAGERDGPTVGQLHRELFPAGDFDRRSLEHVLAGLVRAGEVRARRRLVREGGGAGALPAGPPDRRGAAGRECAGGSLHDRGRSPAPRAPPEGRQGQGQGQRHGQRQGQGRRRGAKVRAKRPRVSIGVSSASAASRAPAASLSSVVAKDLFEALRAWRLGEAQRVGVPAFRILHDRTLLGVATEAPRDEDALLRVAGIGPGLARRYGTALLGIVARYVNR